MTVAAFKNLWESLGTTVRAKILKLSRNTGESPEAIIERGVALYEKDIRATKSIRGKGVDNRLARIKADPVKGPIYAEIMSAMQELSTQSMSVATKKARGRAGAVGRAASLTPAERKKIAKKAAEARWGAKKKPAE